jgi:hypothetical protein
MRTACAFARTKAAIVAAGACAGALLLATSCAPPPRDFLLGPAYSEEETPPPARTPLATLPTISSAVFAFGRRVVVDSSTRALAADASRLYYGNAVENSLFAIPKLGGGAPVVVGQPVPVEIAAADGTVAWIGNPGDAVYRVLRIGDVPAKLAEGKVFTSIVTSRGDVYVTETSETHGVVRQLTGLTAGVLAELDGAPRSLALDDQFLYVLDATAVYAVPRAGGKPRRLAAGGNDLARAKLDRDFLYATGLVGTSRAVVRVSKKGGEMAAVEYGVRDAPIAVYDGFVYYVSAGEPAIRRVPRGGGASVVIAHDDALNEVTALVVDSGGIYVGCRDRILAFALPQ